MKYTFPFPIEVVWLEGQAWCSGESCLTESPGRGFEAASPQICGGKACLGFSLLQTLLMWEPLSLGLPLQRLLALENQNDGQ